jgi:hypothetical protein
MPVSKVDGMHRSDSLFRVHLQASSHSCTGVAIDVNKTPERSFQQLLFSGVLDSRVASFGVNADILGKEIQMRRSIGILATL